MTHEKLNELKQHLRVYIEEYEDTHNSDGPFEYPDPLTIADMKALLKLVEQQSDPAQPQDTMDVLLWNAGRDTALKEVSDIAKLSPHLVNPIFIPAIEGISQTLAAPFVEPKKEN